MKRSVCLLLLFLLATIPAFCFAENTEHSKDEVLIEDETRKEENDTNEEIYIESGDTLDVPEIDNGENEAFNENIWESTCGDFENVIEVYNIDMWDVEDSELETMYNDRDIFRRTANTNEAWIVYELPYVESLTFLTYVWPTHESEIEILFSKDNEEWFEAESQITRTSAPENSNCWSKILYEINDITEVRYVKLVWPEVDSVHNDWWNPYMGWIKAELGKSVPTYLEININNEIVIPRYDISIYELSAKVTDQIGTEIDTEINWATELLPVGVSLENNRLIINKNCTENSEFILNATTSIDGIELSSSIIITCKKPILGDINSDGKITEEDVDYIVDNFAASDKNDRWKEIRMADIDENGVINILDLSYVAYYCELAE